MKTLLLLLFAEPVVAVACPTGYYEYQGNCAADLPAEKAESVTDPSVVSDEKPRREQQREWEMGLVHADNQPSQAAHDAALDAERDKAESEGKEKAGIKENQ